MNMFDNPESFFFRHKEKEFWGLKMIVEKKRGEIDKEIDKTLEDYRRQGKAPDKYNAGLEGIPSSKNMFEGYIRHATETTKSELATMGELAGFRLEAAKQEAMAQNQRDIEAIEAYMKGLQELAKSYQMEIDEYEAVERERHSDKEYARRQKEADRDKEREQKELNARLYAESLLAAQKRQEEESSELHKRKIDKEKQELEEHEKRMRMLKEADDMLAGD